MSATSNTAAGFPSLAKKTWIFAIIRGVLAIIFGLIALFAPIATAVVLAIFIGAWAIVDGVFDIIEAIRHRGSSSMALRIVWGAVSILFGILVLVWPGMSLGVLVIFVGIWAIIIGVLEIMASIRHRAVPNSGWVWGIIGGALAILFGILVLIRPGAGLVSIIWIIGIWPSSGASHSSFSASNSARPPTPPRPVQVHPLEPPGTTSGAGAGSLGHAKSPGPSPRSRALLPGVLRRFGMSPLVYVTRAGVVIAALRRSPPWVTVEADLLAIDHVRDADDADERHRESDEDGD
jgi:uncharacterized membrane protein HdeD (DUF308 family)